AVIMVNGGLTSAFGVIPGRSSGLIDRLGIEQPFCIDESELCAALTHGHRAVEARMPTGMAGGAGLLDLDPDRVLVAVDAQFDHALCLAGSFALAPQRASRTTEIPGFATGNGLAQGFLVHMRDHQHVARRGVRRHASYKAMRVEFGLKAKPLFAI